MANAYLNLEEYQKTIKHYGKRVKNKFRHWRSVRNCASNGNLGNAYHNSGQYQKAIKHYVIGLERTAFGNQSGIDVNNSQLCNAYHKLGEYKKVIKHHEKS